MVKGQAGTVVHYLHRLATTLGRELTDTELLQRFTLRRDEGAFTALVHRHGRLVWDVCHHVLHHAQDAEDAFQATFVVLAANAGRIRKQERLASWLHGVARRVALRARRDAARRRKHEKEASGMSRKQEPAELSWREVRCLLDEEVQRLPDRYRVPFVLCVLEGHTLAEAAQQLGWKQGTVSGRLTRARQQLRQRLARRGAELTAIVAALTIAHQAGAGAAPRLVAAPAQAAASYTAGDGAAAGILSARVAHLIQGATNTMLTNSWKMVALWVLALGMGAAGAGVFLHEPAAAQDASPLQVEARTSDKNSGTSGQAAVQPEPVNPKEQAVAKLTVSGRVLDPAGKPIARARVVVPGAVWGQSQKEDAALAQETTGPDGRFHFVLDRAQLTDGRALVATAEGHALDWIETTKLGQGEVTLRLAPDIPISGRVVDLEGRPITGVSVSVRRVEAPAEGNLDPVLKTVQRDGNRVFRHPMRAVYLPSDVSVFTGTTVPPIVAPVTTDAQGRFRFTGLGKERLVVLRVEGPGIEHHVLYVLTRPGLDVKALVEAAPDRIGIPGRKRPLPVIYGPVFDHPAGPTKPVIGIVRDHQTGRPLADVGISAGSGGWWEDHVYTTTDQAGRYRLIGLPKGKARTLRVQAYADPQGYLPASKPVDDSEGLAALTLDFELVHGVRVRGRITDKTTGKPVPAAIWYRPLADNKYYAKIPGSDFYRFNSQGFRTEKDGSFGLLALPGSGLIKVRAEVKDNPYMQAAIDPADRPKAYSTKDEGLGESFLSAGGAIESLFDCNAYRLIDPAADAGPITCDIQFDRGQTRTGTVVDPDGKPLTGVRVAGLRANGGSQTLAESSFQAVALNPVKPRLLAFVHKDRKLVGHVLVQAEAPEPVTVRLQPGAVLTGRLLDENGKPLVGVTVLTGYRVNEARWLAEEMADGQSIQTDADGRFHIENIFPGLRFMLVIRQGHGYFDTDQPNRVLTLEAGTKDLGNVTARPAE
jgi:RNA polymerase sigma factor (sigma-70 family)